MNLRLNSDRSLISAIEEITLRLQSAAKTRSGSITEFYFPPLNLTHEPLENLCRAFGLSPFERNLLVLCVAASLDSRCAILCARLNQNPQLNYPSFHIAQKIFSEPADWTAIAPDSPLRHHSFITLGDRYPLCLEPIKIDRWALHYLLGKPSLDPDLLGLATPIQHQPAYLSPSQQQLAKTLLSLWRDRNDNIVQLCGDLLTARTIVTNACEQNGLQLYLLSPQFLPTQSQFLHRLARKWERHARLLPSILAIESDRFSSNDAALANALSYWLEHTRAPLVFFTRQRRPQQSRPLITLTLPHLSKSEQYQIWQHTLNATLGEQSFHLLETETNFSRLINQFNLSTPALHGICTSLLIQLTPQQRTDANTLYDSLWQGCRASARPRLGDLAERMDATVPWEDLILTDTVKQTLSSIVAQMHYQTTVYQEFGLAGEGDRGMGIAALFAGQSGTGKTFAARAIASQLQVDLFRIDLSQVVSKYIGETEKNLSRIFEAAGTGGAILLFDEADALFGKRTEVKDSRDRFANIEVSYLLQQMEAYQGLAILTTNMKHALDSAFLRRLRFIVDFPYPEFVQRRAMWEKAFPSATPTEGLDMGQLAKLTATGAMIRNIALNGVFLAVEEGGKENPVTMKHLLEATKQEYAKLRQSLNRLEIKNWIQDDK